MTVQLNTPKVVLLDVMGTLTDGSFIEKVLLPFFEKNHPVFLDENFDKPSTHDVIEQMRTAARRDESRNTPQIANVEDEKVAVINSVCVYVNYFRVKNLENKPLVLYRFQVWFDGYDRDLIRTPVKKDVVEQMTKWCQQQAIKLYVLSHGWAVANRKFLEKTTQGNLLCLITDVIDTEIGSLTNSETFSKVANRVKEDPKAIVYLTKFVEEAVTAKTSGMQVIMVINESKHVNDVWRVRDYIPQVSSLSSIKFA